MLSLMVMIGIGQASIQDPAAPLASASMPGGSTRLAYAYLVQGISLTPEEDAVMDALEQAQPVQQILTARTEYDVYSLDVLSLDGVDLGSVWQIADQQQQHACMIDGFQVVVPAEDVDFDGDGPLVLATFSCDTPVMHGRSTLLATPVEEVRSGNAGAIGLHVDTGRWCELGC